MQVGLGQSSDELDRRKLDFVPSVSCEYSMTTGGVALASKLGTAIISDDLEHKSTPSRIPLFARLSRMPESRNCVRLSGKMQPYKMSRPCAHSTSSSYSLRTSSLLESANGESISEDREGPRFSVQILRRYTGWIHQAR